MLSLFEISKCYGFKALRIIIFNVIPFFPQYHRRYVDWRDNKVKQPNKKHFNLFCIHYLNSLICDTAKATAKIVGKTTINNIATVMMLSPIR
jgi:hypothetical protein